MSKVHYIASGDPGERVTTSCLKDSAGGGIITQRLADGQHVFRFSWKTLRRVPASDFLATKTATLVDCRNCRKHLR